MSFSRLTHPKGKYPKSTNELMIALKDELTAKIEASVEPFQSSHHICHLLKLIRELIYGSIEEKPKTETQDHICSELQKTNLLVILIEKLANIGFEGREDISLLYEYAVGHQIGTRFPIVEYIVSKPEIIERLVEYYADEELVTVCGQIIRGFLRFEDLTQMFFKLKNENGIKFYIKFFDYLKTDSFSVCVDIFSTFHHLFGPHKTLAKEVLQTDYDLFFGKLNELLESEDYYIRRKSTKLIFEILSDRNHQKVMKKYTAESSNLSIITGIMRSDCPHTSFDAFLTFHLFVMNPQKGLSVKQVLLKDKNSLIPFVHNFLKDRSNVRQFENEKEEIIKTLEDLI